MAIADTQRNLRSWERFRVQHGRCTRGSAPNRTGCARGLWLQPRRVVLLGLDGSCQSFVFPEPLGIAKYVRGRCSRSGRAATTRLGGRSCCRANRPIRPWFLVEGLGFGGLDGPGLRRRRRWWVGSAITAISVLTVIGECSPQPAPSENDHRVTGSGGSSRYLDCVKHCVRRWPGGLVCRSLGQAIASGVSR
jgi:hypothetical protein